MTALHHWLPATDSWKRPLVLSVAVTILYSVTVFAYSLFPSSDVSISGTLWHALAISTVFGLGTIGVPVFLWARYEFQSPIALLVGILLFWHVLVYIPSIGTGEGDSPGFLFVFVWAPIYIVAYGILTVGEYWLRGRNLTELSLTS